VRLLTQDEKFTVLAQAQGLLNRKGSQFTRREREGKFFVWQCAWFDGIAPEPYRLKGLRLAVVIDYATMHAEALAFDEAAYDPYDEKQGFPKPVHAASFECELDGLKHVAVANRLEKLFYEIVGIDQVSGIRAA
jgi:hypothetical protein